MIQVTPKHKIFIATQFIDFRKGIDGIVAICRQQFQLDPFSGHLFIFRNRRGNAIKILAYDSQGFWLAQKRLSKGTFTGWPNAGQPVLLLSAAQLQVLLYNGAPEMVNTQPVWRSIE